MSPFAPPYIETTDEIYEGPRSKSSGQSGTMYGAEPAVRPERLSPSQRRSAPASEPIQYDRPHRLIVDPVVDQTVHEEELASAAAAPEPEVLHEELPEPERGSGMAKRVGVIVGVIFLVIVAYLALTWYRDHNVIAEGTVAADDSNSAVRGSNDYVASSTEAGPSKPVASPAQTTVVSAAPVPPSTVQAATATDSIDPNPPNSMVFAGTGKFQVYRQGNITWRLDTHTGHVCALLATEEEWAKPKVYSRGCGRS